MSWRGLSGVGALAVVACLLLPGAAMANDEKGALALFSFKASHGYRVVLFASAEQDDGEGQVGMYLFSKGLRRIAYYLTDGYVTDARVKARFGDLGRVDLKSRSTGRKVKTRVRDACEGGPFTYRRRNYGGIFSFRGEEGFTRVRKRRVSAGPQGWIDLVCRYQINVDTEPSEPVGPGAALVAEFRRKGRMQVGLLAAKNRPKGRTSVTATIAEKRHGVEIARAVQRLVGATAFEYDEALSTASVALPAPFSGSATYQRGATRKLTGNLKVDFPGRADVSLIRQDLRTKLVPAKWSFEPPYFR